MLYIHQTSCISPQPTFPDPDISVLHQPVDGKMKVIEPKYDLIPPKTLRRMSKSVRIGIGAALPILKQFPTPSGIIIGTAYAGFEDCFHFLQQIVDYNEGLLTPGSFVQSTPNAMAAQIGMLSHNKGYNITHVHLGLAFENAMLDAGMLIRENPENNYLIGAVDDISAFNYALNILAGWFKNESFDVNDLYNLNSAGSIAGEGAAMFLVNGKRQNAIADLTAVSIVHSDEEAVIRERLEQFLINHVSPDEKIDLLISGEDGDNRLLKYYTSCENILGIEVPVIRFKHMCGEYPTASGIAVWLACYILQKNTIPQHLVKNHLPEKEPRNILIYNNHKGLQHSFILVRQMDKSQ